MTTSVLRRLDIARFISFLAIAFAITFAVGAISIGAVFVAGAWYFPLLYYPDAIANEGLAWSVSAVYLITVVGALALLTVGRSFVVALLLFVGGSLAASICVHLIMAMVGFQFRAL